MHGAGAAVRGVPAGGGRAGAPTPRRPRGRARPRFEDTDRFVRGRVVAALAEGSSLPDVAPERLERALDGLERDGLIERSEGQLRLPGDALR